MFNNLRKTLAEKDISIKKYAEFLGVGEKTVQNKLNGVTEFTLAEVLKTSNFLLPQYKISYLFKREF